MATGSRIGSAALVLSCVGACAVRLPGDNPGEGDGIPCTQAMECPQPENTCLLAYCMEQQCVQVPAPEGQLPEEEQQPGDCQLRYCDGNGEVVSYPAAQDVPPDDKNACTEERCDGIKPRHDPKPVGTRCGNEGICNGKGQCGECRPAAAQCQGRAVRSCDADGRWTEAQPCAVSQPVCSDAKCVGLADVALGSHHACARFENGSVRCWGAGDAGQLGRGGLSGTRAPVWGTGFRAAAIGPRHACAIDGSGAVWCWGANDFGQLGDGSYRSSTGPTRAKVAPSRAVAVGTDHSCALTTVGAVHCWGRNDLGQLGSGKRPAKPLGPAGPRRSGGRGAVKPQPIAGLVGAAALLLDEQVTCVEMPSQPTRCWGSVDFPQPETIDDPKELRKLEKATAATPTPVEGLAPARQLAAGADFTCALAQGGTVHCWGANDQGQLGSGSRTGRFEPAEVAGLSSIQQIALGDAFACALSAGGGVQCWGANDQGQLGNGKQGPSPKPAAVPGLASVRQLRAGAQFACALSADAPLVCWGAGSSGQLGDGAAQNAPRPVPVAW